MKKKPMQKPRLEIGRGGAQFVASPKGANSGKKPKMTTGNDLRTSSKGE